MGARLRIGGWRAGAWLEKALTVLAPDYIVLAGMGILPASVIATAKRAVINVHPGLLPWIRGTGVVGAAILRGIPVGVTSHLVNAGIDLGDIIERRLVPLSGLSSLSDLERRADAITVEMLADIVVRCYGGEHLSPSAQTERHPICRWLTPPERLRVEAMIADGQAMSVFEHWAARSSGAPQFRLYDDMKVGA